MAKLLLVFFLFPLFAIAQPAPQSDDVFEILKNGAHEKTFSTGMYLSIQTVYDQWLEGFITAIRHDSIFLNSTPFHYKEIVGIKIARTKLNYTTDGILLMVAGGGVLVLGAVNGLYRGDAPKDWYAPASYITAAALIVLGYILLKSKYKKYTFGKKYTLQYLELNPNKNNPRPF